jgi:hypothetical protein
LISWLLLVFGSHGLVIQVEGVGDLEGFKAQAGHIVEVSVAR